MPSKSSKPRPTKRAASSNDVEAFLAALEHPRQPEILAIRSIVLGAAPGIAEGIKWNAPSFRTSTDFATFQLRARSGVQLILHFGATPRPGSTARHEIHDPHALLTWLGDDRASVTFRDLADIEARRGALVDVLRQWIAQV